MTAPSSRDPLERRLDDLERHLTDRLNAHETWLGRIVDDQRVNSENILALAQRMAVLGRLTRLVERPRRVLGRVRRAPTGVARRRRLRTVERRISREQPEVTEAELERRRAVVARFVDTTYHVSTTGRGGGTERDGDRGGSGVDPDPDEEGDRPDVDLGLTPSTDPELTIVVPVHGAVPDLLACLTSIGAHPPSVPYEVIVANDRTDPAEFAPVRRVQGLTVIDNDENIGFLHTCNRAVARASGRLVWLLNSDTELTERAADALIETFDRFDDVGVVGSKLVYPDGTLQEAGGIVWRDATAWNVGRGDDPGRPEFDHLRRVDYVSGASLMIPTELWHELGGFDPAFAPAYYEDTDLCMRVAQRGRLVLYQPGSVVVHHEGRSHGTDVRRDGKRHQVEHHEVFLRKWSAELAARRANGERPDLERERSVRCRVLVIDARMLTPDKDSGSLRMRNLVRILTRAGCRCTFVPHNLLAEEPEAGRLREDGVEVVAGPHIRSVAQFLAQRGAEFDLVLLSRLEVVAEHLTAVRRHCPSARVVYDTVDLHFLRQARELALTGSVTGGFDPDATRDAELAAIERSDVTLVCSTVERDLLAELMPSARTEVLGNIHLDTAGEPSPRTRHGLLFVGGFEHPPNVDAVQWFVAEILPWLTLHRPDLPLHVVGSRLVPEIEALAGPNVIVHGHVPDLGPLYRSCRVSIAPLRYGAGVKGKVTEALARGLPVVATSMAVEGAPLVPGTDVLTGDSPMAFAGQVAALLDDDDLWVSVATAGARAVDEHFGADAAWSTLAPLVGLDEPAVPGVAAPEVVAS